MKEGEFQYLSTGEQESADKGENLLLNQEVITQKDIKRIAKSIGQELRSQFPQLESKKERSAVLVDWLNVASSLGLHKMKKAIESQGYNVELNREDEYGPKSSKDFIRITDEKKKNPIDLYKEDLKEASTRMRRAILEELRTIFPDADFFPTEKDLYDGCIYQAGHDWVIKYYIVSCYDGKYEYYGKYGEDVDRAIRQLYDLDERSPYLAYNIKQRDSKNQIELQKFQDMETFSDILEREDKPSLVKMMQYFQQILEGAKFLVDNNLRLTDLGLDNLAVNTKDDTGLLFDFGNLFSKDTELRGDYATHANYLPPERAPDIPGPIEQDEIIMLFGSEPVGLEHGVVTEAEMVYELGISLKEILHAYVNKAKNDNNGYSGYENLMVKMIKEDPNARISLEEAINEFKQTMPLAA